MVPLLSRALASLLHHVGHDAGLFSRHSLHRGGATLLTGRASTRSISSIRDCGPVTLSGSTSLHHAPPLHHSPRDSPAPSTPLPRPPPAPRHPSSLHTIIPSAPVAAPLCITPIAIIMCLWASSLCLASAASLCRVALRRGLAFSGPGSQS